MLSVEVLEFAGGIEIGGIEVMLIPVIVFGIGLDCPCFGKIVPVMRLCEKRFVPKALLRSIVGIVKDGGTGQAAFRTVVVQSHIGARCLRDFSIRRSLQSKMLHIGIFSFFHRRAVVFRWSVMQYIGVFSVGREPFAAERCGQAVSDFLFQVKCRVDQAERTGFQRHFPVGIVALFKRRDATMDMEYRGSGKKSRRLKNLIALCLIQRDRVYVVRRETADIDLPCLHVGKQDAVVTHGRMACAQPPHRNRFQSPDAAVIFHGYAREVLHHV
jgi:hypothetical protein